MTCEATLAPHRLSMPGSLCSMVPGEGLILTQLRRGALEYCVLAMLQDGRLYGLDIARRLATGQVLMSSEGTLYPLLARLRKAGLVSTTWQESSEGPRAATTSSLQQVLRRWPRFVWRGPRSGTRWTRP